MRRSGRGHRSAYEYDSYFGAQHRFIFSSRSSPSPIGSRSQKQTTILIDDKEAVRTAPN